jgi:RHS repeat-associated protein
VYDGDGNRTKAVQVARVKGLIGGVTTIYIGGYFEWTGSTESMKSYYYAGTVRVAMREGTPNEGTVYYLLGDHLGSMAITTDSNGEYFAEIRYYPWGTERYVNGEAPTSYQFTGQRLESGIGLYYYGARWYDPAAGRFIQADTDVPESQGVQAYDRYAYVNNNPVKYIDPSGHWPSLSDIFSIGATICDITATAVSIVGAGVEAFAAAGGELLSPIPGVDGAAGFIAGVGFYNTVLNPIENSLSLASLGLVSLSDAVSGNDQVSRITDPKSGEQATEFSLGADTTFSIGSILVGNTPLTPDAVSDTVANIATVYYDVKRLNHEEPAWGLWRLEFVQPDNSSGYIKLNRDHEEKHGR